jgi:hypothetical protein
MLEQWRVHGHQRRLKAMEALANLWTNGRMGFLQKMWDLRIKADLQMTTIGNNGNAESKGASDVWCMFRHQWNCEQMNAWAFYKIRLTWKTSFFSAQLSLTYIAFDFDRRQKKRSGVKADEWWHKQAESSHNCEQELEALYHKGLFVQKRLDKINKMTFLDQSFASQVDES